MPPTPLTGSKRQTAMHEPSTVRISVPGFETCNSPTLIEWYLRCGVWFAIACAVNIMRFRFRRASYILSRLEIETHWICQTAFQSVL